MSDRKSTLAPKSIVPSLETFQETLRETLKPYCLEKMLSHGHTILFEGWTDVSYVEIAIEKHRAETGVDLAILGHEDSSGILFATPGKNGDPRRGGTSQMVRLARSLQPYVFTFPFITNLAFVFDHDDAGLTAENEVTSKDFGYQKSKHTFTLDPKVHTKSCAKKQVCVEDLLSLRIQLQFFELGEAYCDVTYEAGEITRFRWAHQSKDKLRDYVVEYASLDDLAEIVELIKRVRIAWGFTT